MNNSDVDKKPKKFFTKNNSNIRMTIPTGSEYKRKWAGHKFKEMATAKQVEEPKKLTSSVNKILQSSKILSDCNNRRSVNKSDSSEVNDKEASFNGILNKNKIFALLESEGKNNHNKGQSLKKKKKLKRKSRQKSRKK